MTILEHREQGVLTLTMNRPKQKNAFNAQLGLNADIFGGLAGLGGSLGSAAILAPVLSDKRLKKNLRMVQPAIYEWEWTDEGKEAGGVLTRGFLAQDVKEWRPDAVVEGPDGYLRIRYEAL